MRHFYLSPHGDNSDGTSIERAWTDWSYVKWEEGAAYNVGPGIYRDPIKPTVGSIFILGYGVSEHAPAIFQGRRIGPLPEPDGQRFPEMASQNGAFIKTQNVTIDGGELKGFVFRNWIGNGIRCTPSAAYFTLKNAEIYNCGFVYGKGSKQSLRGSGVLVADAKPHIERVIMHDNGADGVQSAHGDNRLHAITMRNCWIYNAIPHSKVIEESKNFDAHADGLQIYAGGDILGLDIFDCWCGPGLTNGVVLGDVSTETTVCDVKVINTTFDRCADNGILNNPPQCNNDHIYDRLTVICHNTKWHAMYSEGDNVRVIDSLFEGGPTPVDVKLTGANNSYRGNVSHEVENNTGNVGFAVSCIHPIFPQPHSDPFELREYTHYQGLVGSSHTMPTNALGLAQMPVSGPDEYGCYQLTNKPDERKTGDENEKILKEVRLLVDEISIMAGEIAKLTEKLIPHAD